MSEFGFEIWLCKYCNEENAVSDLDICKCGFVRYNDRYDT